MRANNRIFRNKQQGANFLKDTPPCCRDLFSPVSRIVAFAPVRPDHMIDPCSNRIMVSMGRSVLYCLSVYVYSKITNFCIVFDQTSEAAIERISPNYMPEGF